MAYDMIKLTLITISIYLIILIGIIALIKNGFKRYILPHIISIIFIIIYAIGYSYCWYILGDYMAIYELAGLPIFVGGLAFSALIDSLL